MEKEKSTIHKFKFYVNDIESEVFEYDENNYKSYEDLTEAMEQDRVEWIFNNIDSGWIKINE